MRAEASAWLEKEFVAPRTGVRGMCLYGIFFS
jgi:hypothetical protein